MSTLFSVLVALAAVFLVGYPLIRGSKGERFVEAKPVKYSEAKEKEAIISSLGEIEFDYHMKKLSDEDYETLKKNYTGAAATLTSVQDDKGTKGWSKAKAKSKPSQTDIEREIEEELAALGKKDSTVENCHRCNTELKEVGQEYCHSCGERQF